MWASAAQVEATSPFRAHLSLRRAGLNFRTVATRTGTPALPETKWYLASTNRVCTVMVNVSARVARASCVRKHSFSSALPDASAPSS
eukprot:scaffold56958_cov28-Tisochrysis_lutea.AAC.1